MIALHVGLDVVNIVRKYPRSPGGEQCETYNLDAVQCTVTRATSANSTRTSVQRNETAIVCIGCKSCILKLDTHVTSENVAMSC